MKKILFVKKIFEEISAALIYSNLIISIGAFLLTNITIYDMNLIGVDELPNFVFFATLFAYSYQRQIKIKYVYDRYTNDRARWMSKRVGFNIIMIMMSIIGMIFTLSLSNDDILLYLAPVGLFTLVYILPSKSLGLRNIPFVKIFLISGIWMYVTVILPYFLNTEQVIFEQLVFEQLALYSIVRFMFIFGITIPFDIRDINVDGRSMNTIPQVLGIKAAKILGIIVLLLSSILNIIFLIPDTAYIITSIVAIVLVCSSNAKKGDFFYLGLIDGLMIFWYILKKLISV